MGGGTPIDLTHVVEETGLSPRGRGTAEEMEDTLPKWGLSPRGRGNRRRILPGPAGQGSIPAWAGEPGIAHTARCLPTVYPRVGGGTRGGGWLRVSMVGLSPRGRGNLPVSEYEVSGDGSIPAWAGEPLTGWRSPSTPRVYPRVGGGTFDFHYVGFIVGGLSPRGRGNL